MSNVAVIYKSKYGSTKQYAQWIADELRGDIYHDSAVSLDILENYSTVIYGGGMYMGSILGISFITKNFDALKDKNLVVFGVGLENSENAKDFEGAIKKVFNEEMQKSIKTFHLRGAIDYKSMGLFHKVAMWGLVRSLKKKDKSTINDTDKMIIETYGEKLDFTSVDNIRPLVEYCNKENSLK